MQNFFTPVEVIQQSKIIYSREQLKKIEQEIFQMAQPRVQSLADDRKQITIWLRSLSLPLRQQAFAFHSPEFTCILRKLYQQSQTFNQPRKYKFDIFDDQFVIKRERFYRNGPNREEILLRQLVLVNQGHIFEAVTFNEQLLREPDSLFQLLDDIQGGVIFDLAHFRQQQLKTGKIIFEIQAEGESKTLAGWVTELLLKQISLSFVKGKNIFQGTNQHMRKQQQAYAKLWRQLDYPSKIQLIYNGFQKTIQELMEDYKYSVAIDWRELPILYLQDKKQAMIKKIVEYQPRDILNYLLFTPLPESLSLYSMYKMEIILQIQGKLVEMENCHKKKQKKKAKKTSGEHNRYLKKQGPVENHIIQEVEQQIKNIQQDIINDIGEEIIQPQINQQNTKVEQQSFDYDCKKEIQLENELQILQSPQQLQLLDESKFLQKQYSRTQSVENKYQKSKVDEYFKTLKYQNRDKFRKIILNRLTIILSQFNLICRAFGSYQNRLSLPDSDLDVQIDSSILGLFCCNNMPQRHQIASALEYLEHIFAKQPWISDFTLLPNARIPLLIFYADAGVYFNCDSSLKKKLKVNRKTYLHGQGMIKVDMSIQSTSESIHFGMEVTNWVQQWMKSLKHFQKLALVMKGLVRMIGLHKSYEGGISSYCLILLTVAFLKIKKPNTNETDTIFKELVLFVQEFAQKCWTIDLRCVNILIEDKNDKPVLVNPCDGRNLLERCFRLNEMVAFLAKFDEIFNF